MVEIRLIDEFGAICVDSEDGMRLCDRVHAALDEGKSVCLDFGGVTTLASSFLNASIGCLYAFFSKGDLDQRLRWKNLDATDETVLRFVQKNAIRFYAAKPSQQDALASRAALAAE